MDRDRIRLRWWYPERNDRCTFITSTTRGKGGQGSSGKGKWRYRVTRASKLFYGTIILHFKCPLSHASWRALPNMVCYTNCFVRSYTLCMWKSREKGRKAMKNERLYIVFVRANYATLYSSDNRIYLTRNVQILLCIKRARFALSFWYTSWAYRYNSQCRLSSVQEDVFMRARRYCQFSFSDRYRRYK